MKKPYVCLFFDTQAEQARKFYLSVFKNSKKGATTYYTDGMHMKKGTVLTAMFEIEGQTFMALNGSGNAPFTHAISIVLECKTQKKIDTLWKKLLKGGGKEIECGWLTDKYGVSWQVAPRHFHKWLAAKDTKKIERMFKAMAAMKKLNIARLQKAFDGK